MLKVQQYLDHENRKYYHITYEEILLEQNLNIKKSREKLHFFYDYHGRLELTTVKRYRKLSRDPQVTKFLYLVPKINENSNRHLDCSCVDCKFILDNLTDETIELYLIRAAVVNALTLEKPIVQDDIGGYDRLPEVDDFIMSDEFFQNEELEDQYLVEFYNSFVRYCKGRLDKWVVARKPELYFIKKECEEIVKENPDEIFIDFDPYYNDQDLKKARSVTNNHYSHLRIVYVKWWKIIRDCIRLYYMSKTTR